MKFIHDIRRYTSTIALSILLGAAGSNALADDAGYHAEQLKRIQSQTGQLFDQSNRSLTLSDANSVAQEPRSSAAKRRERAEDDKTLSRSQELWQRFERVTGRH